MDQSAHTATPTAAAEPTVMVQLSAAGIQFVGSVGKLHVITANMDYEFSPAAQLPVKVLDWQKVVSTIDAASGEALLELVPTSSTAASLAAGTSSEQHTEASTSHGV